MRKFIGLALAAALACSAAAFSACEAEEQLPYPVSYVEIMGQDHSEVFAPSGAVLLRSEEELGAFRERFEESLLFGDQIPEAFAEELAKYDDAFFEESELLLLCIGNPYDCYSSEVVSVERKEDAVIVGVEVEGQISGEGMCPAVEGEDFCFIELPAGFCGERELRVEEQTVVD